MKILPVKMAEELQKNNPFVIALVRLYVKPSTLYLAICDEDIMFAGNIYTAFPVEIGTLKQNSSSSVDDVTLEISNVDEVFSSALFNGYDFRGKTIEIIDIAYPSSLSDPTEFNYKFVATLDSPSLDESEKKFTVDCVASVPKIKPGRVTGLSCNAWFGDPDECGAIKGVASGTTQPGSNVHSIITQQTKVDNYWADGSITVGDETRQIKNSTGNMVYLEYPFLIDTLGKSYSIEQGCNKSQETCINRFNNAVNFTGFIGIPWENVIKT